MVVLGRNEVNRMRLAGALAIIMSLVALTAVTFIFFDSPEIVRWGLLVLSITAVVTIVVSSMELFSNRSVSKIILFQADNDYIVTTNHLHDGFKLRFFRDIFGDAIGHFSDEDRTKWSVLSKEGIHPVFIIHNTRKTLILSISQMLFDEVFVYDHTGQWNYFDCRQTSEPTSSERGLSPFKQEGLIPEIENL